MNVRDSITATKCKVQSLEVPEWSTTVHIRQFGAVERSELLDKLDHVKALMDANRKNRAAGETLVWACLYGLCEPDGRRMFRDDEFDVMAACDPDGIGRAGYEV